MITDQAIDEYISRADAMVASSVKLRRRDIVRIRSAFSQFYKEALVIMRNTPQVNANILPWIVRDLSSRIIVLQQQMNMITDESLAFHAQLARDLESQYLTSFMASGTGSLVSFAGSSPQLLLLSSRYSADLVSNLTNNMLRRVNSVLRLGALGATGDPYSGARLINQALGGPKQWSYRAEMIYNTEVLRLHSMQMQVSGEAVNEYVPTDKIWRWSTIKRKEHARISGQRVPMKGKFRVPLKEGGTIRMKFPRDPAAARTPSAVINCGCSMFFLPREADV